MVKAVIFDMDGLMFDTEGIWEACWLPACQEVGVALHPALADTCRGSSGPELHKNIRSLYGEDFDAPRLADTLYRLAGEEFHKKVPAKPGLYELLDYCKAHGLPMAVASSSPIEMINEHLTHHGIGEYFDFLAAGGMVAHTKPAPDVFLLAAEKLGFAPGECLVLEDSYNGIRAGAAGGFITVMVPDRLPDNEEMRSLYSGKCESLYDIMSLLESNAL